MFDGALYGVSALLMTVVGLVLAVACANVAGLLLGRTLERRLEIGIRSALGAGRARIVRLIVTESCLLALISGVLGMVLAVPIVRITEAQLLPLTRPLLLQVDLDLRVLVFGAALTVLTGLVSGLLPGLRVSRGSPVEIGRR